MKKIIAFAIWALISLKITAQSDKDKKSTFYVNVFINESKDIRIESNLVEFDNVSKEVKKQIYEHPFKIGKMLPIAYSRTKI